MTDLKALTIIAGWAVLASRVGIWALATRGWAYCCLITLMMVVVSSKLGEWLAECRDRCKLARLEREFEELKKQIPESD